MIIYQKDPYVVETLTQMMAHFDLFLNREISSTDLRLFSTQSFYSGASPNAIVRLQNSIGPSFTVILTMSFLVCESCTLKKTDKLPIRTRRNLNISHPALVHAYQTFLRIRLLDYKNFRTLIKNCIYNTHLLKISCFTVVIATR